ncbi:hypothetical protein [Pseudomonas sp. NPDC089396]|uniref:hypothetical protein n=1 Tax=Pseudomonas sp. NPDC089396 TaxID=3364461 RepID=UPI00383706FC
MKTCSSDQAKCGCDPGLHGDLHLFVVTNATDVGIGAGTVNTQRMIEGAETFPQVTKLRRIEQVNKAAPPRPRLDGPNDYMGRRAQEKWQAELDGLIEEIEESMITPEEIPGLKVHLCSLGILRSSQHRPSELC